MRFRRRRKRKKIRSQESPEVQAAVGVLPRCVYGIDLAVKNARKQGKSVIWLLHGFNVSDGGAATIEQLRKYIDDPDDRFVVISLRYGWRFLLGVRFLNRRTAKRLAKLSKYGDVAVGHSNGCAIIHEASWMDGCGLARIVYIQPALDRDKHPFAVDQWLVTSNKGDHATGVSKWLLWHHWGDMGQQGYVGIKEPIQLYTADKGILGHSTIFSAKGMAIYGDRLGQYVIDGRIRSV